MTVILVDGPDGVGKTGYARWIADWFGFRFLRMEPDHDFGELDRETIERMSSVFNETLIQLDEQDVDVVVDRGPVSSIVYGRLYGDGSPDHAVRAISEIDPFIVYLSCDPRELEIRYSDEKFDDIAGIADMYDEVVPELESGGFQVQEFDTSSGIREDIENFIHEEVVHE